MTVTAAPGVAFRLATAPARWLGRLRPDLMATVRADATTYAGRRAGLFLLLIAVGLGYTLALQLVHATIGPMPRVTDPFDYATRPFFTFLFSESLLYMIVVAGIGAFSPALGVLLIIVFAPADLMAAAVHCAACGAGGPPELAGVPGMEIWQGPIIGRLISYAVLWILAVEIPIIVRRVDRAGWTTLRSVAWRAAATLVLVGLWGSLTPWLIRPSMVWTVTLQVQEAVTAPLWQWWPLLALGAGLLAGLAAAVARWSGSTGYAWEAPAGVRRGGPSAVRDWVSVVILAGLFAGFYDGALQAGLIIGTLILTLPVLSAVLPRIPVPGALRGGSLLVRFFVAMVVTAVIGWIFTSVIAGPADMDAILAGPIIVAMTAPVFRIIVELGWRTPTRTTPSPSGSTVVTASFTLLAFGLLWLALPALALAGDCPDDSGAYCFVKWASASPALAMAAGAIIVGAALWGAMSGPSEPPPPHEPTPEELEYVRRHTVQAGSGHGGNPAN